MPASTMSAEQHEQRVQQADVLAEEAEERRADEERE